jgi:proteasome lid subunit RPN8/RPN11
LALNEALCRSIFDECVRCYPEEACGVVIGTPDRPGSWRYVPFENLQNELHARDPAAYPRDARTAFTMHPLKLQRLIEGAQATDEDLVAIVHSHPDHLSYFSEMDRRAAAPFGSPTYPQATQLVVSVFDGAVRDIKGFVFDGEVWPERPLEGVPALPGPPADAPPVESG